MKRPTLQANDRLVQGTGEGPHDTKPGDRDLRVGKLPGHGAEKGVGNVVDHIQDALWMVFVVL
jgi:hypothetical protein